MPFRALLFDIGDTLWHARNAPPPGVFRALAAERAAAFLRDAGIPFADPSLVARTAWDAMEAAMRRARETDLVEPHYGAVTQSALRSIGLSLDCERAAALLEATYVSGVEGGKAPYPDATSTLMELRGRGFRLAVVTNRAFGGERFRADLRAAGLDVGWDAEVVSVEIGYLKPHQAVFEHTLSALGMSAGECLMVGNSLAEDVAGAQRAGIAAAWRRSAPDAEGIRPDFEFDELSELLELPELQEPSA